MANMNDCPEKLPLTDEYLEKRMLIGVQQTI